MRFLAPVVLAAALAATTTLAAAAEKVGSSAVRPATLNTLQDVASPYLRVFGVTPPPYGHVDFCMRDPAECADGILEETRRSATPAALAELDRVNRQVNAEIKPMTDRKQYGIEDYWTLPESGKGDCEDYALLKRQRLIRAGWPVGALLMTVVFDEKGEGHAILTARTAEGDYILDNKTDVLKLWSKTPYHFVMRQSYLNARVWMSLDPKTAIPSVPMPVAGMRVPAH